MPYLPALVWAALLLYIGGRSTVPAVETSLPLDKVAHFGLYGVLGALATLGWIAARTRTPAGPGLPVILALALAVGAADELNQRTVPNRSPEFADWLADAVGVVSAATLVLRLRKQDSTDVV